MGERRLFISTKNPSALIPYPASVSFFFLLPREVGALDGELKRRVAAQESDAVAQTRARLPALFFTQPEALPAAVANARTARR